MAAKGWSVVRFWSHHVLGDRAGVLGTIVEILEDRLLEPVIADDIRFLPAARDA
jgi:very-short-patch-repair endonuclease